MSTTLNLAGVDVRAVSVGGLETCIELPAFKIAFDIGRCPPTAARMKRILFTHAHIDHMGGVAHHLAMRDLLGMPQPDYFVPSTDHEAFLELLAAWRRLARSALPCRVVPVAPGDQVPLGKGITAHVFRSTHRVPTVGYALARRVERLKPELVGIPGEEIRRLRQAGEGITVAEERVEAAFCGDTTAAVLDREPLVQAARLLILECTFLDGPVARARNTGHVHLDELLERVDVLGNERILLTHFSARYGAARIRAILDERLPARLRDRVVPLLPGPPWESATPPA